MDRSLPIYVVETEFVTQLKATRRVILSAPTASGKSTQVPQILLNHHLLDHGQAVILEPRRLAARLLASRVAQELHTPLGREVGYHIRFDHVAGPSTRIQFVTEGILLRQMIQDPHLTGIAALILDEFHERHLYSDITLARALDLQEQSRRDLLIIVMSATLDIDLLRHRMEPCAVVRSEGRSHPIHVSYRPRHDEIRVSEHAADAFAQHIRAGGAGDTLIFMPGSYEISRTIDALRERPEARSHLLLPLHGELNPRDQDAAVARYEKPKIVVATNVAETSLTIDGVTLVIDSGLAKVARYDPYRGINTLFVEKISRASADQRAGRAGRTAPGMCIRLWSEREHATRPARDEPEVRRLDLAEALLTLKAAGVHDLRAFRWLEAPTPQSIASAMELLQDLGALRGDAITPLGREILAYPIHPRYGRILVAARALGCVPQAALAAALTQGRDILHRTVDRTTQDLRERLLGNPTNSDFELLMRAWRYAADHDFRIDACERVGIHAASARQVAPLYDQFIRIAGQQAPSSHEGSDTAWRKCLLAGFSDRVARRMDEGTLRCSLVHGRSGVLARESIVRDSPLVVAAEVREVEGKKKSAQTLLSLATAIDQAWLRELYPDDIATRHHVTYDSLAQRVCAEEQLLFRDLPLESTTVAPPPEQATKLLADEVLAGRLSLNQWDQSVEQWLLRLKLLAQWCSELELAPFTESDRRTLIELICRGATTAKEIKNRPVLPILKEWIGHSKAEALEKHAPERLPLNRERKPRLNYVADGPPYVALRIQELYDISQIPRIALGRVLPLVHILAPNMRPVQITQDLSAFWRDHYPKLKRELQRKYPKHKWR